MQLEFFYILESNSGLENIEITFSEDFSFRCSLEVNEISIYAETKTPQINRYIFKDFPNIIRTDLIVGENGSGKSTILECLKEGGVEDTIWIAIFYNINNNKWYFQQNNEYQELKVNLYINTILQKEYPISIYDIDDTMYRSCLVTTAQNTDWFYKYKYHDENEYINMMLSVFDFVNTGKYILNEFMPVHNLRFSFTIQLHFIKWMNENRDILYEIPEKLKSILVMATDFLGAMFIKAERNIIGDGNICVEYLKFLNYSSDFMVNQFNKTINGYQNHVVNGLKMLLYLDWIITSYVNSGDEQLVLQCINDRKYKNIVTFNEYLFLIIKEIISKDVFNKSIIKAYIEFDFVNKIFDAVSINDMIVEIHSSSSMEFSMRMDGSVTELPKCKHIVYLTSMYMASSMKSQYIDDPFIMHHVGYCNLSTGEMDYINLFAQIYQKVFLLNDEEVADNVLLLLDEPDRAFHPEWSRKLMYTLLSTVNELFKNDKKKCQLIITTHSPFMVSDLPSNCVTALKVERNSYNNTRSTCKVKKCFAANIYDLLNDGFYMEAPVGNLAKKNIQKLLDTIEGLDNISIKQQEKVKYIEAMLNEISDQLVRGRIYEIYNKKRTELLIDSNQMDYLINEIYFLKKEIEIIKKQVNHNDSD